jgi:acetyltransferase-like isoleucine patch superfamily enzyme
MREVLKTLAYAAAKVLVLPCLLMFWLESWLSEKDVALRNATELLAFLPGIVGRYLRRAFLSMTLERCAPSVEIGFCTTFSKCGASIGANVYIGANCSIGLATIEPNVMIASGVYVTSGAHQHGIEDLSKPIREQEGEDRRVVLGMGSWVGANAVIMADVGKGAVVAAGAVVAQSVPDFAIVGGVPARVLRSRLPSSSPPS